MNTTFLGKKISGVFTIPSGIVTTHARIIERVANEIPQLGVITTKSIGPEPRAGNREPILSRYAPGCFVNAVGLTNPGAAAFARQLEEIEIPDDRFLLISIFGKDAEEFVSVAKMLAPRGDGLELNLSCPHASGYGMAIGQDRGLVKEITAAVKNAVDIPVIPKLTPNTPDIGDIAKAAAEGGADAICAINAVGPGFYTVDGNPVLSNKFGGMSGRGILPIGLKCLHEIRAAVDLPIIGCGGISGAEDVRAYKHGGAEIFGVGSALAGLKSDELKEYFRILDHDLNANADDAVHYLHFNTDMSFSGRTLTENIKLADDLSLLVFEGDIPCRPGQFVFAWIPGVGEKPFSVLDDDPLTLAIQNVGFFTEKIIRLDRGAEVYFRGPYGTPPDLPGDAKIILVGGGTGVAAMYTILKSYPRSEVFVGAKDKAHLFYLDKFKEIAEVNIATDDGSLGCKGFVTELLKQRLDAGPDPGNVVFLNCGPKGMVDAALEIERKYASNDNILNSIDYYTKCGVGICGSCATPDGGRSCVDGPFIPLK
ncbi:MAG: dihydroorotate dehydrogenase [Desulfobacterales bacterium]|nr:dihydroorotate dehydrogenase [Desulfobacterales bacterium]